MQPAGMTASVRARRIREAREQHVRSLCLALSRIEAVYLNPNTGPDHASLAIRNAKAALKAIEEALPESR